MLTRQSFYFNNIPELGQVSADEDQTLGDTALLQLQDLQHRILAPGRTPQTIHCFRGIGDNAALLDDLPAPI